MRGEAEVSAQPIRRSLTGLAFGVALIVATQGIWACSPANAPKSQVRTATMGLFPGQASQFAPFYYRLGQIPVVGPDMTFDSSAGAADYARLNGPELKMDVDLWSREGDLGRIWLYAPWAWMGGSGPPTVHPANTLVWTVALLAFFLSCWWVGRPAIGWATCGLLSISPFYLYAVHGEENLFWLPGAVFLLVGALALPVAMGRIAPRWMTAALISAGAVVGLGGSMRREVWPIVLVAVAAPWFSRLRLRQIFGMCALPALAMVTIDWLQLGYFDAKWADAVEFVASRGGEPVTGQRMTGHTFWHPVWCGLGDFGSDKNYAWQDAAAYRYGFGEIKERYGIDVRWNASMRLGEKDPPGSSYTRMAGGYPHYEQVLREKVVSDIKADPLWYFRILVLRLNRIMATATPFNGIGYLAAAGLVWALVDRRWLDVWLILGSLSVSFSAITVYSGNGATWSGLFGVVGVAVTFDALLQRVRGVHTDSRDRGVAPAIVHPS